MRPSIRRLSFSTGTAKPIFEPSILATTTPTRAPLSSTSGPPLLPGFTSPSICTESNSPSLVVANARNRALGHGDGRVGVVRVEVRAEGEAEGQHRHCLHQLRCPVAVDGVRRVFHAGHLEDRKVVLGVVGDQYGPQRLLLRGAAAEDDRELDRPSLAGHTETRAAPARAPGGQFFGREGGDDVVVGGEVGGVAGGAHHEPAAGRAADAGCHRLDVDTGGLQFLQGQLTFLATAGLWCLDRVQADVVGQVRPGDSGVGRLHPDHAGDPPANEEQAEQSQGHAHDDRHGQRGAALLDERGILVVAPRAPGAPAGGANPARPGRYAVVRIVVAYRGDDHAAVGAADFAVERGAARIDAGATLGASAGGCHGGILRRRGGTMRSDL